VDDILDLKVLGLHIYTVQIYSFFPFSVMGSWGRESDYETKSYIIHFDYSNEQVYLP